MLITIIYIGSSNNLLQDVVRDYEKRIKNLGRSIGLKEIIYKEIKNSNKIEVLSISSLMAEAIKRISNSTSVSDLFN